MLSAELKKEMRRAEEVFRENGMLPIIKLGEYQTGELKNGSRNNQRL